MVIVSPTYGQGLWPTFHNDAQRTGYSLRPGPSSETLLWSDTTGGGIRSSPAIAGDGTVYIGSLDSNLYAVDEKGTLKWQYSAGGEVYSPPAIGTDGTIYFGSIDGYLYALEDSVTYGKLRWQFAASGAIRSPTLIGAQGILYFKAVPNKFYAVNPNGTEKWVYTPETGVGNDGAGVTLSPDSATLYFIAGTGSGPATRAEVYAIDTSGTLNWTIDIGAIPFNYPADVSPLVDTGGIIYVPTLDAPFYAINPDGSEKWQTSFNVSTLRSTPALGPDGTIYVGSSSSLIAINSSDGSFGWSFPTPSGRSVYTSPAVDSAGVIYFGDDDNWNLYAVDPDGTLKWTFSQGGVNLFPDIAGSPAIGWDSTVIFGSASTNIIYALGKELTGLNEESQPLKRESRFLCAPSIFRNRITLKFTEASTLPLKISLYSVYGGSVFERSYASTPFFVVLDDGKITGLSSGIYFLSVSSGRRRLKTIKLIKL